MIDTKRLFYKSFFEHDHVDSDGDPLTNSDYDYLGLTIKNTFKSKICPNCNNQFSEFSNTLEKSLKIDDGTWGNQKTFLFLCKNCGWWQMKKELDFANGTIGHWAHQYHSILEEIDIAQNNVLIANLRQVLLRNWEDRKYISANKAEELVRDILKDHLSCDVTHSTANVNAADGGIDLFVCSSRNKIIAAVQVKRRITKNVEPVNEIRNFVGALVVENIKKGIFVTTADKFTLPAKNILKSKGLKKHRLELELIDGEKLLELLKSTTPPETLELPMGLALKSKWLDIHGNKLSTREILLK